jgi:uncharacterized protein TIGR03905
MKIVHKPSKVCANLIEIEVDNDIVQSVNIQGGCDGNLKGISKLAEGMKVSDVIDKLKGITCGNKSTSCPDQLACALKDYKRGQ